MKNPITVLLVMVLVCGCAGPLAALTWTPGWTISGTTGDPTASVAEFSEARRLGGMIDSAETARTAIRAWEGVTAGRPGDPEAWIELATLRLLEGAAYRKSAGDRLKCYVAALQDCERAMATNPEFLRRVREGQQPWEAVAALGPREMGAMNFWSTGVFYIFRDCLGLIGRIRSVRVMEGAKEMLVRMDAIDPAWEGYVTTFSWGIYYLAMPSSRGGDKVRARECFDTAVARGTDRTLPRWGRAKYFHLRRGDTAAAQADLALVAASNLDELGGNRSWNRYFKSEAAGLLRK
jgi:hypothetical protein